MVRRGVEGTAVRLVRQARVVALAQVVVPAPEEARAVEEAQALVVVVAPEEARVVEEVRAQAA